MMVFRLSLLFLFVCSLLLFESASLAPSLWHDHYQEYIVPGFDPFYRQYELVCDTAVDRARP